MTDYRNVQSHNFEAHSLIDEVSSDEIYIGISSNGRAIDKPIWKIKKIWKDGTIWRVQFPDGDQTFSYTWNDRIGVYTYL